MMMMMISLKHAKYSSEQKVKNPKLSTHQTLYMHIVQHNANYCMADSLEGVIVAHDWSLWNGSNTAV